MSKITKLSNLALKLYSWYIKNGHARNEEEAEKVRSFFKSQLTPELENSNRFYDRLYLYQSFCWYHFIRQDFLNYYRYTQKWVDLFEEQRFMIEIETANYIKGLHNLISAHFDLSNAKKFEVVLKKFEEFSQSSLVTENDNNRIQTFVYLNLAKLNQHFMLGTFTEGLQLVPFIEEKLQEYSLYLDRHRVLVFYYKIASLYFGSGDYDSTIDYLNKIINWKVDLRTDLQCYARLLHLIAHYELGNFDILEYLIKSVYRFMAKMDSLSVVEEEIFTFIRNSFQLTVRQLKPEFKKLLDKLNNLQSNPYETRAFLYLDIPSWLESKVKDEPVQKIIRDKYVMKLQKNQ
jgi:tetratricopeptide (TPR) repeat protein